MKSVAAAFMIALFAGPALAQGESTLSTTARSPTPTASPETASPGPTRVEQTGTSPDSGLSYTDMAWDSRIRASVAAAQALQGPLDGRWTLYDAEGKALFIFQLVDPAGGQGSLEGVWRDLRRPPGSLAYGMIVSLQREGSLLTAAFAPRSPGPLISVSLQSLADGRWSGEMTENGVRLPVTLRRY